MRPDVARDRSGLRLAAVQFLQFTAIGGVGLFVDMGALWVALQVLLLDAYAGRVFSYLVAATFTWVCNRAITFKSASPGGLLGQWARYLMANAFGAVVNFAIYALVIDPISFLWVAVLFVFIYQIEGHVVVPNVMANALRLHPLLVIFGLLAGGEIYGLPGILLALPLMAAVRAIWEFFAERVSLEPWSGAGPVPVEVELESPVSRADDPLKAAGP